jgi:hypothetical protein
LQTASNRGGDLEGRLSKRNTGERHTGWRDKAYGPVRRKYSRCAWCALRALGDAIAELLALDDSALGLHCLEIGGIVGVADYPSHSTRPNYLSSFQIGIFAEYTECLRHRIARARATDVHAAVGQAFDFPLRAVQDCSFFRPSAVQDAGDRPSLSSPPNIHTTAIHTYIHLSNQHYSAGLSAWCSLIARYTSC